MKALKRITVLLLALAISGTGAFAQSSIKLEESSVKITTTRFNDIRSFQEGMEMFTIASESGSTAELKHWLDKQVYLTAVELKRSKMNLDELKRGDIKELQEWQENNQPDQKLNVNLEITLLQNKINSLEYLYKRMSEWPPNTLGDSRSSSTLKGTMNAVLRKMESNLKYGDGRISSSRPGSAGSETTGSGGYDPVVKKTIKTGKETVDPNVKRYNESRAMTKTDFEKYHELLKTSMRDVDEVMGKKAFHYLLNIMSNEINMNNWMLSMISSRAIKNSGISEPQLSATIKQQQGILDRGHKLKPKLSESFGENSADALKIADDFAATL